MCVVLLTGQADAFQQLQQAASEFEQHLVDSLMLQVGHEHELASNCNSISQTVRHDHCICKLSIHRLQHLVALQLLVLPWSIKCIQTLAQHHAGLIIAHLSYAGRIAWARS